MCDSAIVDGEHMHVKNYEVLFPNFLQRIKHSLTCSHCGAKLGFAEKSFRIDMVDLKGEKILHRSAHFVHLPGQEHITDDCPLKRDKNKPSGAKRSSPSRIGNPSNLYVIRSKSQKGDNTPPRTFHCSFMSDEKVKPDKKPILNIMQKNQLGLRCLYAELDVYGDSLFIPPGGGKPRKIEDIVCYASELRPKHEEDFLFLVFRVATIGDGDDVFWLNTYNRDDLSIRFPINGVTEFLKRNELDSMDDITEHHFIVYGVKKTSWRTGKSFIEVTPEQARMMEMLDVPRFYRRERDKKLKQKIENQRLDREAREAAKQSPTEQMSA